VCVFVCVCVCVCGESESFTSGELALMSDLTIHKSMWTMRIGFVR
jgi:hypothetical protein